MVVHKAHSVPFEEPTLEAVEHFKSVPFCSALFNSPTIRPIATLTRIRTPSTSQNALVAKTLATDETVQAWQSFWEPPCPSASLGQVIAILTLAGGLSGHAHTLHGGFISLLLDEVMNYIGSAHLSPGKAAYTAFIKVEYKKPVTLPSTILSRAWLEERSGGRKLFIRGSVEDGQGGVHATAESLFLEITKPKANL